MKWASSNCWQHLAQRCRSLRDCNMLFNDLHSLPASAHCILMTTSRVRVCYIQVLSRYWGSEEVSSYISQNWAAQNGDKTRRWGTSESLEGLEVWAAGRLLRNAATSGTSRKAETQDVTDRTIHIGKILMELWTRTRKLLSLTTLAFMWATLAKNQMLHACFSSVLQLEAGHCNTGAKKQMSPPIF